MTLEKLRKINPYLGKYGGEVNGKDVEIANGCIKKYARKPKQLAAGDIVEYTNPYAEYSARALVERVEDNEIHICEHGSGWCCSNKNYLSVSGGAFYSIDRSELEYVGRTVVYLKEWGHLGACASGAILFPVRVNLWKNKHEFKYTTKDYNRRCISKCDEEWLKEHNSRYEYDAFPSGAWEDNETLSAWCIRNGAFITKSSDNLNSWEVWSKKTECHYWLDDESVLAMDGFHDVQTMNGSIRNVCYVDSGNKIDIYFGKNEYTLEEVSKKYKYYFAMSLEKTKEYVRENNIRFPESFMEM